MKLDGMENFAGQFESAGVYSVRNWLMEHYVTNVSNMERSTDL